jgi:hypothetical protein
MKLLGFIFMPFFSIAQNIFEGVVINKSTKQPIPYVTVSLVKSKAGVNTDENGYFKITIPVKEAEDSLLFTCMGYAPLKLPIENTGKVWNANAKIELIEVARNLKEVVVQNNNFKNTITLNDFTEFSGSYYGDGSYITQLAQHFVAPSENAMLKEIKIAKFSIPILSPQKAIFRIRVYDVDPISRQPVNDLTDQIIEVKATGKLVKVNVEKYKIIIPNKEFFVAIEWLRIPYNATQSIINEIETEYAPSIGFNKNSAPYMDVWELGSKNIWDKIPSYVISNLAIAVSLKY